MFPPVRRDFLFQLQKFVRIHGCILTADAEMDVSAHYGFHQGGIPGIADGLPHGYGVPRFYAQVFLETGIAGGVAAGVADDHGIAQAAVSYTHLTLPTIYSV